MEVNHRGLYGAVPETVFHGLDVLSIFQKVCGERMTERVGCKPRVKPGARKASLSRERMKWLSMGPQRRNVKNEIHARVMFAVGFQNGQRLAGDRHDPIIDALATFDVDHSGWKSMSVHLRLNDFKCTEASIVRSLKTVPWYTIHMNGANPLPVQSTSPVEASCPVGSAEGQGRGVLHNPKCGGNTSIHK